MLFEVSTDLKILLFDSEITIKSSFLYFELML